MFRRSLVLVLLGFSCLLSFTTAQNGGRLSVCCFEFHKIPIPFANIDTAVETRFDCSLPGVILTMRTGLQICVDPDVDWVQEIMKIKIKPSA